MSLKKHLKLKYMKVLEIRKKKEELMKQMKEEI